MDRAERLGSSDGEPQVVAAAERAVGGYLVRCDRRRGRSFDNSSRRASGHPDNGTIVGRLQKHPDRAVAVPRLYRGGWNFKELLRRIAWLEADELRWVDQQASARIAQVDLMHAAIIALPVDAENEGLARFDRGRVQN